MLSVQAAHKGRHSVADCLKCCIVLTTMRKAIKNRLTEHRSGYGTNSPSSGLLKGCSALAPDLGPCCGLCGAFIPFEDFLCLNIPPFGLLGCFVRFRETNCLPPDLAIRAALALI